MGWPPAELRTCRLHLRQPAPADAQGLFTRLSSDVRATRYLGWRPHTDVTQTRQQISLDLLRRDRGSAWSWLMEHSGEVAGLLQLAHIEPHLLRLGFMLTPKLWGKGLMGEALNALLANAFTHPGLYRIEALCDTDNQASIRLLEKIGFQHEGRLCRHTLHPNISEHPRDMHLYALTRRDNHDIFAPDLHAHIQT